MLNTRFVVLFAAALAAFTALLIAGNDAQTSTVAAEASSNNTVVMPVIAEEPVLTDLVWAGSRLVAVGESGAIRVSDDDGLSWQPVTSGVTATLTAVTFVSDQVGWAVGHRGIVLTTLDSGNSWQQVDVLGEDGSEATLLDVAFGNNGHGLIVGAKNLILETNDGGASWAEADALFGYYRPDINAAAFLESGLALVVDSGGNIHTRKPGDSSWDAVDHYHSKALQGVIGLGGNRVLAFGSNGSILESDDEGATWKEQSSASSAGYFAGRTLRDGSVVLVGSQGTIVRRVPGGGAFYPDENLPAGTLTGVAEGNDGRLVVTGIQGVGRQQADRYDFGGGTKALTGHLYSLSLMKRPELARLFELMEAANSYYSRRSSAPVAEWVEVSLSAKDLNHDVLTANVFNAAETLYQSLAGDTELALEDVGSIWGNGYQLQLLEGPHGSPVRYPVIAENSGYDDGERPYLERRIVQAGLPGTVISEDYRILRVSGDVDDQIVKENDQAQRDGLRAALAALRSETEAGETPVRIAQLEYLRLEAVPADDTDTQDPGDNQYLYVFQLNQEDGYGRCDEADRLNLSAELERLLIDQGSPGPVLSVAVLARLNAVARRGENWKWYAASDKGPYGRDVVELWKMSYCINPLAIVFGHPGSGDQSTDLRARIGLFNQQTGLAQAEQPLELSTYRLTRTAF